MLKESRLGECLQVMQPKKTAVSAKDFSYENIKALKNENKHTLSHLWLSTSWIVILCVWSTVSIRRIKSFAASLMFSHCGESSCKENHGTKIKI
jgi:hypothetical protein